MSSVEFCSQALGSRATVCSKFLPRKSGDLVPYEEIDIAQLLGIVLDDTRCDIKGYLYEAPFYSNQGVLISAASSLSQPIPWAVRETLCGQIVSAMSSTHARGLMVGAFYNNGLGVRADGTAL